MGLFDFLPPDDDDLDNHHPVCKGPCGQLADECMCHSPEHWYRPRKDKDDVRNP